MQTLYSYCVIFNQSLLSSILLQCINLKLKKWKCGCHLHCMEGSNPLHPQ